MADEKTYWPPFNYNTILHPATASTSAEIPGPDKTRLRDDLLLHPPAPPEFIVKGFLPIAPGILIGAGGAGKTTLMQWEQIHIVLGLDLYGLKIEKPGAVLSVTKEDERSDYEFRAARMLTAMRRTLTDVQIRQCLANSYVMQLSGTDERLVKVEDGNLLMTNLAERIIKKYRGVGLALIIFDTMIFFGPGERYVNDGEAHLMQVARLICNELGCCVMFVHHTGKENFREGRVDMYSGRGGSAGADNARFVHVLIRHTGNDFRRGQNTYVSPPTIPTYAIEQGAVLRLHVEKMSGAPRIQEPIWIERDHWMFRHHETPSPLAQRQAREESQKLQEQQDAAKVASFIGTELQNGIKHSTRSLVSRCSDIGISKARVQRAIEVADAGRLIVPTPLPTHERRGTKSYFFDLPSASTATPAPQKPAPRTRRSRSAVTKK